MSFLQGLAGVAFPNVCLCCGRKTVKQEKYLCSFCLTSRFEEANLANRGSASGVILPDKVVLQHALWKFDKGGDLQHLLHSLKYDRLTGIGRQLGKALARSAEKHPGVKDYPGNSDLLLVPVPLHYLKFRKRGFNQAFTIARGVEEVLKIPICNIETLRRKKYTQSQTGFTLEKRIKNMRNAFQVKHPETIEGKTLIIIDDVFTTGSTAFELSKTLKQGGASAIMIWTIAQA